MERRTYELHFTGNEEDAFAVIAHDGWYGLPGHRHYLPMKMQVRACECDGEKVDFTRLIYTPDEDTKRLDTDFFQNRVDILQGKRLDWILSEFKVMMTGICLRYYNKKLDDWEEIYLHVCRFAKKEGKLHVQFDVPHANDKPDTRYEFCAECYPDGDGNFILLESFGQDTQRCMSFGSDGECGQCVEVYPDYAEITEYIDI